MWPQFLICYKHLLFDLCLLLPSVKRDLVKARYPVAVRGWDGWAREVGLLSLTSQPNVKKSDVKMRIIFSHRGVWPRLMQSCIRSGRFYAVKKHCLEAWSCQGCFLDIVKACVQILNKYERLFTKERQGPSGHADAVTLRCMFVCLLWKRGILRLRFMLLYKEQNIT